MDDEAAEFLAQDAVTLRAGGKSVREIARLLTCTQRDVNEALDDYAKKTLTPQNRARLIGSELATLDAMSEPFIMAAKTGDAQAAIVVLKIQTRRAALLGLDAPLRVDPVQLIEAPRSSTEQILAKIYGVKLADSRRRFNGGEGYGHADEDAEDAEILRRGAEYGLPLPAPRDGKSDAH